MKKRPKNFGKMSLEQQEVILIGEYEHLVGLMDKVRRELAQVRGGYKIQGSEDLADRPDLVGMKVEAA